jgi:probable HAF family extracellular repeat protein
VQGISPAVSDVTVSLDGVTAQKTQVRVTAAAGAGYTVTDIGSLGGTVTIGQGINNQGQVVGLSALADGNARAFVWTNGVMTLLPGLSPGGDNGDAGNDINDAGVIVGSAGGSGNSVSHLVIWRGGTMMDIGATDALSFQALAHINSLEHVAYINPSPRIMIPPPPPPTVAFWNRQKIVTISTDESPDVSINNNDTISFTRRVALSGAPANYHASIWRAGVISNLPDEGMSRALDINDKGDVVGSSTFGDGNESATLWSGGTRMRLPTLSGFGSSRAYAVTNDGLIVGTCFTVDANTGQSTAQPAIWHNGIVTDLHNLTPAGSLTTGHTLYANINDVGQILLVVSSGDQSVRTLLLTPK